VDIWFSQEEAMLSSLVIAAAMVMEQRIDPTTARQVFEAVRLARSWSERRAEMLYPMREMATMKTRQARAGYQRKRSRAATVAYEAALKQIAEAYQVSRRNVVAIASDPRVRMHPFVIERLKRTPTMPRTSFVTRFDPGLVVLPSGGKREDQVDRGEEIRRRAAEVQVKETPIAVRTPGDDERARMDQEPTPAPEPKPRPPGSTSSRPTIRGVR